MSGTPRWQRFAGLQPQWEVCRLQSVKSSRVDYFPLFWLVASLIEAYHSQSIQSNFVSILNVFTCSCFLNQRHDCKMSLTRFSNFEPAWSLEFYIRLSWDLGVSKSCSAHTAIVGCLPNIPLGWIVNRLRSKYLMLYACEGRGKASSMGECSSLDVSRSIELYQVPKKWLTIGSKKFGGEIEPSR